MSTLISPAHVGSLNGQPLRFFKAPVQGPHLPWHAVEDLHACLALPCDLRLHFQRRLQSSEWKGDIRTVATADGIVTIAPHFVAQGLIGAIIEVGQATAAIEIQYARQTKDAWDRIYPGQSFADAIALLATAFHNEGGGPAA